MYLDDENVGDADNTHSPTSFVTSISTSFHTLITEANDYDDDDEEDVGVYVVGSGIFFFPQTQEPNKDRPKSREPSLSPTTVSPSVVPSESPVPTENGDSDVDVVAAADNEEREVEEKATKVEKIEYISTQEEVEDRAASLDVEKNNVADNKKQSDEKNLDPTNHDATASTTSTSYLRQEPSGAEKMVNRWSSLLIAAAWCTLTL